MNVFRQRGDVAMVIRFIKAQIPSIEELHLPQLLKRSSWKNVVWCWWSVPPAPGKSTTLASMIDYRNQNMTGHILSIEDPIEFLHSHKKSVVNQREIGLDAMNYENALKNALREAPDVIMIGEIRDAATMQHAIAYAGDRAPVPVDAARQQRQPGAGPHHQLLPRQRAPPDPQRHVAQPQGRDLAAPDPDRRRRTSRGDRVYCC